jgi:hypothetical protein
MPYFSNAERRNAPRNYIPAEVNADGSVTGPSCCFEKMIDVGECGSGCCDFYVCKNCNYRVRIEWPD